ncbi:MarR family transcriptional regulator [Gordonia jinghuaiqii]|uniref:MarR family transcriptional regulator n=1 Tax=Gordonia jinghuaiqii TaxID=2758710 RepID=A0A7D7LTW9_9ACTN|nr:MarR family transcriptional regulator [Gordonia jinghuaiqii]MCR5976589.1 MarR family transcriptional regulator [Gordonia jinghuaiqii]QMS99778.1 MarR family transcriptional regulator [Gordonia jinghuaiqii]
MSEIDVLQAVRLKGRATVEQLGSTTGLAADDLQATLDALIAGEHVIAKGPLVRISDTGRGRLAELLAVERAGVDAEAFAAAYSSFREINGDFKALITDWQLRDGQPNPHDDAEYDSAVLARLPVIHRQVSTVVDAAAAQVPRLARYRTKLDDALARVSAGDTTWLAKPIADSYHTVWFELHEELILAAGLTRDAEAQAGHAQ